MINVIFFGSADFAIESLRSLLESKQINVQKIITKPATKQNRKQKLQNNIVHDFAISMNYNAENIIHAEKLVNNHLLIEEIKQLQPDFIAVSAYGLIIPEEIIQIAKYEILNTHPSRLPLYRGAMPIERAIENGEQAIDISIINVTKQLDAGDILAKVEYFISQTDHASDVYQDIAKKSGTLLLKTIIEIYNKNLTKTPQIGNHTYANKLNKEELLINFKEDAKKIFNKIRAFNMHGMYFLYNGKRVKILKAEFIANNETFYGLKNDYFQLSGGIIKPILIQPEGKNVMNAKEFLLNLDNNKIQY